jgi:Tfp pilus assembly protein PilF
MKARFLTLCLVALLSGCASQQVLHAPVQQSTLQPLFQDPRFAPPSEAVSGEHLFTVTDGMRRYLADEVAHNLHGRDVRQALFDALYRKDKLKLEYDSAMTRNAQQAFEARTGNCLSLVIMTAALAHELGLDVQYQRVITDDAWSRSGNLYFSSGHVNLVLGQPKFSLNKGYNSTQYMTVDFIPLPENAKVQAQPLEEPTIVAMYMNNRAAELLVQNKLDDAYWWARQAILTDPSFLNSYNTLGVIYQHHNDVPAAERILRYAHKLDGKNTIFMHNLAQTLEDQGQLVEAKALRVELAQLEPYPPFYFFNLGRKAMEQGDFARARNLFLRELDRSPDYHEFHFWLAVADFKLGNLKEADEHMHLAMENSTTRGDRDLYTAKLDRIKAYEAQPKQ